MSTNYYIADQGLMEKLSNTNLGQWNVQKGKLFEFIYSLVDRGLKYDQILGRAESWNEEQTINFLPFYVREQVDLACRRSAKKKHLVIKKGK